MGTYSSGGAGWILLDISITALTNPVTFSYTLSLERSRLAVGGGLISWGCSWTTRTKKTSATGFNEQGTTSAAVWRDWQETSRWNDELPPYEQTTLRFIFKSCWCKSCMITEMHINHALSDPQRRNTSEDCDLTNYSTRTNEKLNEQVTEGMNMSASYSDLWLDVTIICCYYQKFFILPTRWWCHTI